MFSLEEYRALHEGAGLADRSSHGRLVVSGADRRQYLQGLLTNDIEALTAGTGCYAAYLTAQGRMIADLQLFEIGDRLLVHLDRANAPDVRDRWSKFVFSEDVQIDEMTEATGQVGVFGPTAAGVLAAALDSGKTPAEQSASAARLSSMAAFANSRWEFDGVPVIVVRPDDTGVSGFDVVVPIERKEALLSALADAGAVPVAAETLDVCRIEAGRPLFNVDMDQDTIPLEAGIEDRAISLTKGCYVGQEIIIRVLHRGHGRVAKRLVGLLPDPSSPTPLKGDPVRSGDREIGAITSAAFSPALDRPIALGYVHRDFTEPGTSVSIRHGERDYAGVVAGLPFDKLPADRPPLTADR